MSKRVEHITIVGGGTSGWLTALSLSAIFPNEPGSKPLRITLIESPNVPTVGVGEATVPSMAMLLRQTGVNEREFFRECNASFKLGVLFKNWNVNPDGSPREFINPFGSVGAIGKYNPGYFFNAHGRGSARAPNDFTTAISTAPDVIQAMRGPRPLNKQPYEAAARYAYHLDAGLFANYMRTVTIKRGVEHIRDDVVNVELDERGFVAALDLKETGRHEVELVIDCTGFKGLVIQEAMGQKFDPLGDYIMNDKAVAVQLPHPDPTCLEPCTRSTALSAGWTWKVPLYSRIGTGYVFSSDYLTDDQAVDEFLESLGPMGKGAQPRVLSMRVGKIRQAWVKNCIAIGLSSGFIEPLESTAIYMVEMAVRWLFTYFPDKDFNPALAKRFNRLTEDLHAEVRDFIVLHYRLNNRTDSQYWIDARENRPTPDSLKENLKLWETVLPNPMDLNSSYLFDYVNYAITLFGKGFYDDKRLPMADGLPRAQWNEHMKAFGERKQKLVNSLPGHYDLLCNIRGEKPAAAPTFTAPISEQPTVAMPGAAMTPKLDDGFML